MRHGLLSFGALVVLFGMVPLAVAGGEGAPLGFQERPRTEFQPAEGEELTIPFRLTEPGEVRLTLYSGDGDLIRGLGPRELEPGSHEWTWDGRDESGDVVPDEAYFPVLTCDCPKGRTVVDPRRESGGVPIEELGVRVAGDGTITYRLPEPARTLVRAGIEGGAMVKSLDTWSPHTAGRVRQNWKSNGAMTAGLRNHPDRAVLVRAFTLPDHAIITSGNDRWDYLTYRRERNWPPPDFDPEAAKPSGGEDGRLARQARLPHSMRRDPSISLEVVDGVTGHSQGLPVIAEGATFRVDMAERDRWLMQQSLYEVAFFLDYRFVSEEETGYTPLSWRWSGNTEPGVHTMTVNVSGLWGQVGVATIRFRVPETEASQGDGT